MRNNQGENKEEKKFDERILHLRRVSKKTTGGNYISFSALVAVGDGKGNVGVGLGRGLEVPPAIQKAIAQAKKNMVYVPIFNDTLPHQVQMKYKSSVLLLKPAPQGTGLKVGGVVRAILDIAGVNNASGKIIGTRNQITNAYAVVEAIKKMKGRIISEKRTSEKKAVKENNKTEEIVKPEEKKVEKKVEKKETKKVTKKSGTKKPKKSEGETKE